MDTSDIQEKNTKFYDRAYLLRRESESNEGEMIAVGGEEGSGLKIRIQTRDRGGAFEMDILIVL